MARKVSLSPSVHLDDIAEATEGYTGADLQALLYNAHLEVIHTFIETDPSVGQTTSNHEEEPIRYTSIGGPTSTKVMSRAEETAFQRRV